MVVLELVHYLQLLVWQVTFENKKISVLDMTGMSQKKNGSVSSHLRFYSDDNSIGSQRIPDGHLDLLLSYDLLGISDKNITNKINHNRTNSVLKIVINNLRGVCTR